MRIRRWAPASPPPETVHVGDQTDKLGHSWPITRDQDGRSSREDSVDGRTRAEIGTAPGVASATCWRLHANCSTRTLRNDA
jgi:hypothetical protein